jgi:hypothetical protein
MIGDIEEMISLLDKLISLETSRNPHNVKRLIRRKGKNNDYFYQVVSKKEKRIVKYFGDANSERVKQIKINEINRIRVESLKYNKSLLESVISNFKGFGIIEVKKRISPIFESVDENSFFKDDFEELWKWAKADYERNKSPFPDSATYAIDGTRVRSKGECIWYNELVRAGIPFRYDSVILVKDEEGNLVERCPDFLFKCLDGTFIIVEHAGMLGKMKYANDFIIKTQQYLRSGFVLGDNFFVTSDDEKGGFDSRAIRPIIQIIIKRIIN